MKRDIYQSLLHWKNSPKRKPLILRGSRQVGKTHLLQKFAQREYENFAYVNFEENSTWSDFFTSDLNPQQILGGISIRLEQEIHPEKTLLIFDEIQECPNALNSLKYFNEQANEYHIAAAGSLLGVKMAKTKGFPVGKVNFIDLHPLNFAEFLEATGKPKLRQYIDNIEQIEPTAEPIHQELISWLKKYMLTGGMPEAVAEYSDSGNVFTVREIQQEILRAYELDFAKHAPTDQIAKISTIWHMVPTQLAKENKKFIFTALGKSARAREYEAAIQWLCDAGLVYKSYNISTPKLPLKGYISSSGFKIFLLDVGLLGAMAKIHPKIITEGNQLFFEYNGAFTENFVAQELTCHQQELFYWTSRGMAEVDFLIDKANAIYPLEVKAAISRKKKSLQVYNRQYAPPNLLRSSLMNLKKDDNFINYPLYLVNRACRAETRQS